MRRADLAGGLLTGLIIGALTAMLVGLILQQAPAVVWRHVLFAVGIVPLILGAMLYFVPVLTRSAPARKALLLPAGAFVLGICVVAGLAAKPAWLPALAAAVGALAALELVWMWRRRQAALAGANPGVNWYLCALAALVIALALIVARAAWPEFWADARIMHLHLNLLGFLGLTAIGTLRVLLPTALGERDAAALPYLRRQLPYAVAGALAIALGAAYWLPLALLGALAWAWPAVSLLRAALNFSTPWPSLRGAGLALAAAALGWLLALVAGAAHGIGVLGADTALALLLYLFLLPLVTGATSHLLPVWRWPGVVTDAHGRMRARLTANSGLRVAAFWLSAVLAGAGLAYAMLPAALALLGYLMQVLMAYVRITPGRSG
jgi:hypothetical protein